jgi:hypothetical protein
MSTALRVFSAFIFSFLSAGLISAIILGVSILFLDSDDPTTTGIAAGQYMVSFAFLLVPAIIVACFRSQYPKRQRLFAVARTFLFLSIIACLWVFLGQNLLSRTIGLFSPQNAGVYTEAVGTIVTIALFFASGLLTSRFLPRSDRTTLDRPPFTVKLFEHVFYLLIATSLAIFIYTFDVLVAMYQQQMQANPQVADSFNVPGLIVQSLSSYAVMVFCVISIVRYGSIMVRNTYVTVMIFSLITGPTTWYFGRVHIEPLVKAYMTPEYLVTMGVTSFMGMLALVLIMTPSARRWINGASSSV